jgi:(p)ppGpp synthase/HD superfamily hydrolase
LQRLGLTEVNYEKLARDIGYKTPDDLFIALGCSDLSISKIIKQFSESEEQKISSGKCSSLAKDIH